MHVGRCDVLDVRSACNVFELSRCHVRSLEPLVARLGLQGTPHDLPDTYTPCLEDLKRSHLPPTYVIEHNII